MKVYLSISRLFKVSISTGMPWTHWLNVDPTSAAGVVLYFLLSYIHLKREYCMLEANSLKALPLKLHILGMPSPSLLLQVMQPGP